MAAAASSSVTLKDLLEETNCPAEVAQTIVHVLHETAGVTTLAGLRSVVDFVKDAAFDGIQRELIARGVAPLVAPQCITVLKLLLTQSSEQHASRPRTGDTPPNTAERKKNSRAKRVRALRAGAPPQGGTRYLFMITYFAVII